MKNFIKYLAIAGFIATGLACEKKSTSDESEVNSSVIRNIDAVADVLPDPPENAIAATGNTVTTSFVIDRQSTLGERPAGGEAMTWEEIMVAFPVLSERVISLAKINKIIETDARTIDLYVDNKIIMTLKYNETGDALTVITNKIPGFKADLITFETLVNENKSGAVIETVDFMMSACLPGEVLPEKKVLPIGEPDKKCAAVVSSLRLREVVEAPEEKEAIPPPPPIVPQG